jgi:hypothetical protein
MISDKEKNALRQTLLELTQLDEKKNNLKVCMIKTKEALEGESRN